MCGSPGITGGSSETGNSGTAMVVSGTIVDSSGHGRSDVDVRLLPSAFNPAEPSFPLDSMLQRTGADGRFRFAIDREDTVTLSARESLTGSGRILFDIAAPDSLENTLALGHIDLSSPTSLTVSFGQGIDFEHVVVYVPGTPWRSVVDTGRTVVIDSIPDQDVAVVYYDRATKSNVARTDGVGGAGACRVHKKSVSTDSGTLRYTVITCR